MSKRVVWFDARNLKNREKILPMVYNLRYEYVVITPEMVPQVKAPRKINFVIGVDEQVDLKTLPKEAIIFSPQVEVLQKAKKKGYQTALYHRIEKQADMDASWREGNRADF
jgi:3-amino-4-hydroxybenzoic acid synthase